MRLPDQFRLAYHDSNGVDVFLELFLFHLNLRLNEENDAFKRHGAFSWS